MGPRRQSAPSPILRQAADLPRVPYGYAPLATWHRPRSSAPASVRLAQPRNGAAWWAFSLGLFSLGCALRAHEDSLIKTAIAFSLLAMASGIIGLSVSGSFRLKNGRLPSVLGLAMAVLALMVSPRPSGATPGPGLIICEPASPQEAECVLELPPQPQARPLAPPSQAPPKAPAAPKAPRERQTAPRPAPPSADPDEQEEQF
ncbi:MAG: hypothetical protein DCC64_04430 [Planctomycetota bacterium]|nr:MAG: hypothetical protein DCC64_04430 [Planctomycetota bacterium]